MLVIKDPVLEKRLKQKAIENNLSVELYISKVMNYEDFDIDFREENVDELPEKLVDEILESRKIDRS